MIGEQEDARAELGGDDVLGRVVADHQAGLGALVQGGKDLLEIFPAGLGEMAVFIGGDVGKVAAVRPDPGKARLRGGLGEKGAGRERQGIARRMQRVQLVPYGIPRRNERADAVEFLCIEGQERRFQRAGVLAERAGKAVPKAFAIGLFAVAAGHGDRALPDSV